MNGLFRRVARAASTWAGSPTGLLMALAVVLAWAAFGPFVDYSETWQLVINTGTTIITFLMTFLIQATQNHDSAALHTKLDAFIAASEKVSDKLIGIEKEN